MQSLPPMREHPPVREGPTDEEGAGTAARLVMWR